MNILQKTFKKKNSTIPIWFMRQAGRYLPEYMEIRNDVPDFLSLCYDSKKASLITIQPVKRFGLDAAIIFSDILVLPHVLGWDVEFLKGEGPILRRFESKGDFFYLTKSFDGKVKSIFDTVSSVRSSLSSDISVIGFAGSPWTVVSYMLEGRGKQDFSVSKNFIYSNKELALSLVEFITEKTIEYLSGQIASGADVIQLFDSWSGVLSPKEYEYFVIRPTKLIVDSIKKDYPNVPIIGFPRCSGYLYQEYIDKTNVDGVSVDQFVPLNVVKKWQTKIVVQGNLDPVVLLSNKKTIKEKVDDILSNLDNKNLIFNLGHGILPSTQVENVEFLVNYVRGYKK